MMVKREENKLIPDLDLPHRAFLCSPALWPAMPSPSAFPPILLPLLLALLSLLAAGPSVCGSEQEAAEPAKPREGGKAPHSSLRAARRYYEGKVADNTEDAESWHGLAVVLRRSEMYADSVRAMTRAVELEPTPERHRELG